MCFSEIQERSTSVKYNNLDTRECLEIIKFIKKVIPDLFIKRYGESNLNETLPAKLKVRPNIFGDVFVNTLMETIALKFFNASIFNIDQLAMVLTSKKVAKNSKLINQLMGENFFKEYEGIAYLLKEEKINNILRLGKNIDLSNGDKVIIFNFLRKNILPNYLNTNELTIYSNDIELNI